MGLDWTQILVVAIPYAIGHCAGLVQMWMKLRHDAELGRSMRPPKPKRRPVTDFENPKASQLDDPNGPPTKRQRSLPPHRDDS